MRISTVPLFDKELYRRIALAEDNVPRFEAANRTSRLNQKIKVNVCIPIRRFQPGLSQFHDNERLQSYDTRPRKTVSGAKVMAISGVQAVRVQLPL